MQKLTTVDADTLLSTPLPKTTFFVDGLIPQGLHILCGSPKIGKSWLMLWLCMKIAVGELIWEQPITQSDVLYLCLEDTFTRIQERLFLLADTAPCNLRFAVASCRIGEGLEEQIEGFIQSHPQTRFIAIDTLQRIRGASFDQSAYRSDYREITALKTLVDRHGLAIVLVHHLRKLGDTSDPFNQVSGTTGLTGAVDSTFLLRKESRASDTATLMATGRDIEYQELVLRFADNVWELLDRQDAREIQRQETPAFVHHIVSFMQGRAAWRGTATELMQAMNETTLPPNVATKYISQHYYEILKPAGVTYRTHRTGKSREMILEQMTINDGNDGEIAITNSSSSSSPTVNMNETGKR